MTDLRLDRRGFLAAGAALPFATRPNPALAANAPRRGGTLRISVDQAASVLNPLKARVNPEYLLGELLYSGLTRLAPDMTAEPDLALRWSNSDDLKEWRFELRPGLTFHDGSPCTAADVAATFTAILDPRTGSAARTNIGPVASVAAAGPTTAVFRLKAPYADLPVALAYTNAKIVPAHVIASGLDRLMHEAVGTGPFKLLHYEAERRAVVARNPAYYDPARPHLDQVEMLVYPDPTAESSALLAADTDLMASAPPSEFARLSADRHVIPLRTPSGQFLNVNMGCDAKPFSDVRVRQALALTVDRTAMVGFIANGYGTPGQDTPMNPAYHYFKDVPHKTPDITRAKRLLAEAGYPNGIDLTLVASDRPGTRVQLAVALREMAKPAGFRITVQGMPHATYLAQVWKKGPFYVGFYNMQATADAIFSLLYTSDAAWNETRWDNASFDKLVNQARVTLNDATRADLYGRAQVLMNDQVPSVIPVFFDLLAARRKWVEGYTLHPRGAVFRLDHVWLGEGAPKRG